MKSEENNEIMKRNNENVIIMKKWKKENEQ